MDEAKIIEEYRAGANVAELAEKYGTYGNKIHRILKKAGEPKRTMGEIQAKAIKDGRKKHPTAGKKLSDATKAKIGKSNGESWKNISEEELNKRSEKSKELWAKKTDTEKEKMKVKAFQALRLTCKEGSKAEKFVVSGLRKAGYSVEFHRQNVLKREKMEIDIYIPELLIAIELDGPFHTENVFGEEYLSNRKHADFVKNALIVSKGCTVLRVIMKNAKSSNYYCQIVLDAVLKEIDRLGKIRNCDRVPSILEVIVDE